MDHITVVLLCVVAFCACMILYKLVTKAENKMKQRQVSDSHAQLTAEQTRFLQTVGRLFSENRVMPLQKVYEECGIPSDIVYGRNPGLIEECIPFEKGGEEDNVFKTYAFAVSKRDKLKNSPLLEHPNSVLNLNLHSTEKIYHVIRGVVFYQEKTTVTNFTYSGVRWVSGPLQTGTLNVLSHEYTRFAPVDSGFLVFTNERLIFLGKQKNVTKQIKLSEILYNSMYQDGVMVHVPNKKPLLFKFPDNKDFEIYEISDGVNEFAIVFDRMKNGNYLDNLAPSHLVPPPSVAFQDFRESLESKNFDPLISDILSTAIAGTPIQTSSIQRKYEIGYAKAGKIMDQLEALSMVSAYANGKRTWLVGSKDIEKISKLIEEANPYTL